jgi:hypothetical protein
MTTASGHTSPLLPDPPQRNSPLGDAITISRLCSCFRSFGTQLEQSQQDFVALRLALGNRARAHLCVQTIDQLAPNLGD